MFPTNFSKTFLFVTERVRKKRDKDENMEITETLKSHFRKKKLGKVH